MHRLREMDKDWSRIPELLKENGTRHKNYKTYTSMDAALEFLLDGYLFLSDGCVWNDIPDRNQMKDQKAHGKSFSFSTRENIAMWMLYGDKLGQNGAILNFVPSTIDEILKVEKIDVVRIYPGKKTETLFSLYQSKEDFTIFMTDVLYTDEIFDDQSEEKKATVNITYNEQHIERSKDFYKDPDVFTKRYEWCYEKECRLVVKPSDTVWKKIDKEKADYKENDNSYVCLRLFVPNYRAMKERIIRSPIYEGKVLYGQASTMTGEVDWKLVRNPS